MPYTLEELVPFSSSPSPMLPSSLHAALEMLRSVPASPDDLVQKWRARFQFAVDRGSLVPEHDLVKEFVRDVESVADSLTNGLLSYSQAEALSGYGQRTLRRMVQSGEIEAEGSHRSTRLRRGSIPIKGGVPSGAFKQIAPPPANGYDADADARRTRRILSSKKGKGRT